MLIKRRLTMGGAAVTPELEQRIERIFRARWPNLVMDTEAIDDGVIYFRDGAAHDAWNQSEGERVHADAWVEVFFDSGVVTFLAAENANDSVSGEIVKDVIRELWPATLGEGA